MKTYVPPNYAKRNWQRQFPQQEEAAPNPANVDEALKAKEAVPPEPPEPKEKEGKKGKKGKRGKTENPSQP